MLREKYVQVVDYVMEQLNTGGYLGMPLSSRQILMKVATKCQDLADEESAKLAVEQPKLIQSNPYVLSQFSNIWAEGFEAGQKSTLTLVSVTGRWGQSVIGDVWFVRPTGYEAFQHLVDSNQGKYRWLSDEETREF